MTRVFSSGDADLALAAELLRQGRLVAVPTETVYGLAARAFDERAVAKIFEAKERPLFDPLILHLPQSWIATLWDRDVVDAGALGEKAREIAGQLMAEFWPGPLTLVLPKAPGVPDLVTSGLPTVAIRVPRHHVTQRLLRLLGSPLAAPSANRFGRISPTSAADVLDELDGRIDAVIDGGTCEIGLESTVVRIAGDSIELLRPGSVSAADLERAAGVRVLEPVDTNDEAPQSPWRLESHYAPRTPLRLAEDEVTMRQLVQAGDVAMLFFSEESMLAALPEPVSSAPVRVLSPSGDPSEAGRNLFRMLRELDGSGVRLIVAEAPPGDTGISHAIVDRLRRAAGAAS